MKIGTFTKTENGFEGYIQTLAIEARATIEKQEKNGENHADYAVKANGQKIGAAWNHTDEERGDYVSIQWEEPSFADGFYKLVKTGIEHTFSLTYSRPKPKKANKQSADRAVSNGRPFPPI